MKVIDTLAGHAGLYILTATGELGFFDPHQQLQVDGVLSRAFAEGNREFLRAYLRNPQADRRRLALIHAAADNKPWGKTSLFFEDAVVRELYPVGGRANDVLTAFQQKNREKSIYRGMELLLEQRHPLHADAPVYCPVLFNRHTTLAHYREPPGQSQSAADPQTPVIEVLNLVATLPLARRTTPAILAFRDKLHQGLINKAIRQETDLALRQTRTQWDGENPAGEAYADIARDKRQDRQVTLSAPDLERLHQSERYEQVERWLEIPHRPVDAAMLRGFVPFRDLGEAALAQLAARSLVYTAPVGARLLDRGMSDAWNMYLLEGMVSLVAADGAILFVEGGTEKAGYPVSFLKPRKYTVDAITPVSFLWVHDLLWYAVQGGG